MKQTHLSIDDWRALAKAGDPVASSSLIRKQYVAEVVKAEGDAQRTYQFTLSTGTTDRDKDTVLVSGWKLENYQKNPVVLFAHDYRRPPVGRSLKTWADSALHSEMEFAPKGAYELADTVEALVAAGFMKAVSVGFRALTNAFNKERRGYDILSQELVEYSIVPVPANPEALIEAKSMGIELAPLRKFCEQILDDLEPGLWVPKAAALRALEISTGEPKSVTVSAPAPAPKAAPEPSFVPTLKDFQAALTAAIESETTERVNHVLGRLGD